MVVLADTTPRATAANANRAREGAGAELSDMKPQVMAMSRATKLTVAPEVTPLAEAILVARPVSRGRATSAMRLAMAALATLSAEALHPLTIAGRSAFDEGYDGGGFWGATSFSLIALLASITTWLFSCRCQHLEQAVAKLACVDIGVSNHLCMHG